MLQRSAGNAALRRVLQRAPAAPAPATTAIGQAFVREPGLNLRADTSTEAASLGELRFGERLQTLGGTTASGWQQVAVRGQTGYVAGTRIHRPPPTLVEQDPALRLIRVSSGQTFWGLVKQMYGIQGDESTPDQNVNHFINAIRTVNNAEAFEVKTDVLDDIGNALIPGRDASDTLLRAGVDLWIPSFGVAARMDVGSGTVTGELSRIVAKIEQKIADFGAACRAAVKYIPGSITQQAGAVGAGLLTGLIDFAKDAAIILATSTAVGALVGALFGGVGAVPGAEIGFEIGLLILKVYGLAAIIEAVLAIAGQLLSQLGLFVSLAWGANGDRKQIEVAGKALADALGTLVAAVLVAVAAYLLKKGGDALSKTKFARTVGEKPLAQWMKQRQGLTTTKELLSTGGVFRLPTPAQAARRIKDATPVGSALKADPAHRAATFVVDDVVRNGSVFKIVGGDKVARVLVQVPGGLNGTSGRYEWILDGANLTHQMFVRGGTINGVAIKP